MPVPADRIDEAELVEHANCVPIAGAKRKRTAPGQRVEAADECYRTSGLREPLSDVTIMQQADPAFAKVSPNVALNIGVALIIGIILGLGIV